MLDPKLVHSVYQPIPSSDSVKQAITPLTCIAWTLSSSVRSLTACVNQFPPQQVLKALTWVIVLLIIGQPACPGGPPKLLGKPGASNGLLTPNSSPVGMSMKLSGSLRGRCCIGVGDVFMGYVGMGRLRFGCFRNHFSCFS